MSLCAKTFTPYRVLVPNVLAVDVFGTGIFSTSVLAAYTAPLVVLRPSPLPLPASFKIRELDCWKCVCGRNHIETLPCRYMWSHLRWPHYFNTPWQPFLLVVLCCVTSCYTYIYVHFNLSRVRSSYRQPSRNIL